MVAGEGIEPPLRLDNRISMIAERILKIVDVY